jgi:hypothetical protein
MQVQIHHRSDAGRSDRITSSVIRAVAHPAEITVATIWSFASSGGGAGRREVLLIPPR